MFSLCIALVLGFLEQLWVSVGHDNPLSCGDNVMHAFHQNAARLKDMFSQLLDFSRREGDFVEESFDLRRKPSAQPYVDRVGSVRRHRHIAEATESRYERTSERADCFVDGCFEVLECCMAFLRD